MNFDMPSYYRNSPLTCFSVNDNESIYLKEELRLCSKSYKIRGVQYFFASLQNLPQTIEVLSAGNLALAAARECQMRGIGCRAIVPIGMSAAKRSGLLGLGAQVTELEFSDIWTLVLRNDLRQCDQVLHPLNPRLLEGYGMIGREIREQMPNCDGIVIPFGLGGLTLGIINELRTFKHSIPVYICEIKGHDPLRRALSSRRYGDSPRLQSFIEAMGAPGVIPDVCEQVAGLIEGVVLVTIDEVKDSIRRLYRHNQIRAEGAAGAAMAAALKLQQRGKKSIAAVLTGGNISPCAFSKIIGG